MRCMVETQYDAACCGSTASLQFHTSYFLLHTLLLQYYEICYNADIRFRKDTYV